MKKKLFTFLLLPAVAFVAVGATVATQVAAHGDRPAMIENLVEKLGVSETEVKTAIEEIKAEHKAAAETRYEEHLSKAVANGELTEYQKQLILDKRAELKAKMQNRKAELQAWADQNGIDLKYLVPNHKGLKPHGFHPGFHKGSDDSRPYMEIPAK